jgi:hypothetical protein
MADDTYNNQNIYRKQEGDELVVADGGQITVESGGEIEVESGGKQSIESGGILELLDGALAFFKSSTNQLTADQLQTALFNPLNTVRYCAASVSTAGGDFSVLNLPSTVGVVFLSLGSNTVDVSFYMTSCTQGQDVWIKLAPGSVVSGAVALQFSGCSFVGSLGLALTSISLYNSAASVGAVHLKCFQDDEWTIVSHQGDNTTES